MVTLGDEEACEPTFTNSRERRFLVLVLDLEKRPRLRCGAEPARLGRSHS